VISLKKVHYKLDLEIREPGLEPTNLFVGLEISRNVDPLLGPPEVGDVGEVLGQLAVGGDDGSGHDGAHLFAFVFLERLPK